MFVYADNNDNVICIGHFDRDNLGCDVMKETSVKIDGEKLDQAITNVALNRLKKELREAIVFGPPILGEIFQEYNTLVEQPVRPVRKVRNGKPHPNKKRA